VKSIRLVAVKPYYLPNVTFLYELLEERDPVANISHRKMPTFEQHRAFVESKPYKAWYIVEANVGHMLDEPIPIGSVYLTDRNEIGIHILKAHQGYHYGKQAVRLLMEMHPSEQFLANIAPGNARSIGMFENIGFKLIQLTLAKETP
jgi:RimJ/RimL family protein N-acetyltransferase